MTIICSLCKKPGLADPRNGYRQKFCSRKACQRARRNQSQRERRAKERANLLREGFRGTNVNEGRSPEAVIDVVLTAKHPVIYGLVSMWLDSVDKNEIEAVIRRLWAKGRDIQESPTVSKTASRRLKS